MCLHVVSHVRRYSFRKTTHYKRREDETHPAVLLLVVCRAAEPPPRSVTRSDGVRPFIQAVGAMGLGALGPVTGPLRTEEEPHVTGAPPVCLECLHLAG